MILTENTTVWLTTSNSRKILLVSPQPFFAHRGTPINVKAMVSRLAEIGYEPHLLVLPHGERIKIRGVHIHRCLSIPGIRNVPIGFSWQKLLYGFILFWHALFLTLFVDYLVFQGVEEAAIIVGCLSMLRRKPYIVDIDSCMLEQLRRTSLRFIPGVLSATRGLEKYFIRRANAVVTVCQSLTDQVRKVSTKVPIFQIEDFPVDGASGAEKASIEKLRDELSLHGKKVFLYTGNLESYQGIELLLTAFSRMRRASVSVPSALLIVGGEKRQIEKYRSLSTRLGIEDSCIFAGVRPSTEMPKFLGLADALVSPRLSGENTPLKIYSYMASGKPIVATALSSHLQVLNSDSAILSPASEEEFSRALAFAVEDSSDASMIRARMIENSLSLISTRYSKKQFDRRIYELYTFLLGPRAVLLTKVAQDKREEQESIALAPER